MGHQAAEFASSQSLADSRGEMSLYSREDVADPIDIDEDNSYSDEEAENKRFAKSQSAIQLGTILFFPSPPYYYQRSTYHQCNVICDEN